MKFYEEKMKKKKRRKRRILLSLFLLFFVCAILYLEFVVNPLVMETTRQMIFSMSTSAVSDAVYDVLKEENITYQDLVVTKFDEQGNITNLAFDSAKMNLISRRFYQVAQVYLDKMNDSGVDVPLGAFSGLPFLCGFGPKINLKLFSIGSMTSVFENSFVSAGINQTNHSIFIKLFASVGLLLPLYKKSVESETQVLIAESVIVGKVPQVYLSQGALSFNTQKNV